ncbi:hypothetical protein [Bacillus sp. UMB0728]|nr:hypothetical protein [Bacillus sp. UMB0728]
MKPFMPEETNEDRIFQLECQVTMLTDLIVQLIGELKDKGIHVSDKLNN